MIRRLLGLGILLVACIIGYNLYFGNAEEKENAREIVNEVKNIGKASWDLLKSEKEKMEAGKYDEAADKFKDLFDKLKGVATKNNDRAHLTEIEDLERRLEELNRPQDYSNTSFSAEAAEEEKKRSLKQLYEETERIMKEME